MTHLQTIQSMSKIFYASLMLALTLFTSSAATAKPWTEIVTAYVFGTYSSGQINCGGPGDNCKIQVVVEHPDNPIAIACNTNTTFVGDMSTEAFISFDLYTANAGLGTTPGVTKAWYSKTGRNIRTDTASIPAGIPVTDCDPN